MVESKCTDRQLLIILLQATVGRMYSSSLGTICINDNQCLIITLGDKPSRWSVSTRVLSAIGWIVLYRSSVVNNNVRLVEIAIRAIYHTVNRNKKP